MVSTMSSDSFAESEYADMTAKDVTTTLWRRQRWVPRRLVRMFVDEWIGGLSEDDAWRAVQASDEYEQYYPGNRRNNGTLRMSEFDYYSTVLGYRNVVESVNINPAVFADDWGKLIAGDVDVDEFAFRVSAVTDRVLNQLPEIRQEFANISGLEDWSRESIIAAMLKPNLGVEMLEKRISTAEIAGEASFRDFDLTRRTATKLYQAGVDRNVARELFGDASDLVPILSTLAARHDDPDDDFDINEFLAASAFDDPRMRRRMRRLMDQERASFTQSGTFAVNTNEQRALAGLQER